MYLIYSRKELEIQYFVYKKLSIKEKGYDKLSSAGKAWGQLFPGALPKRPGNVLGLVGNISHLCASGTKAK